MKPRPTFSKTAGIALVTLVAVGEIGETSAFLGGQSLQQGSKLTNIPLLFQQDGSLLHGRRFLELNMAAADDTSSRGAAVGPKASGRRRSSRSPRQPRTASSSTGPKATGSRPSRRSRAERGAARPEPNPAKQQSQMQPTPKEPFDGKILTGRQEPKPEAPRFDLRKALCSESTSDFRCVTQGVENLETAKDMGRPEACFEYKSLDDLVDSIFRNKGMEVPSFSLSEKFNSDEAFRKELRSAIRLDVFETTPFYANLPEKAKTVLLLPDSSLEGSWRIPKDTEMESEMESEKADKEEEETNESAVRRMKHTTRVLNQALNKDCNDQESLCFTGDDLFEAIGSICGDGASTHWIDIYGVQDRKINHSWHLDAGRSPQNCKTVLWGFPPENDYRGTGVFSHIVSLEDPFGSTVDIVETGERSRMEPVLFEGTPGEDYVFRPLYEPGKELLIYRDIDVLHSAPDVAYRESVMRFM